MEIEAGCDGGLARLSLSRISYGLFLSRWRNFKPCQDLKRGLYWQVVFRMLWRCVLLTSSTKKFTGATWEEIIGDRSLSSRRLISHCPSKSQHISSTNHKAAVRSNQPQTEPCHANRIRKSNLVWLSRGIISRHLSKDELCSLYWFYQGRIFIFPWPHWQVAELVFTSVGVL